MRIFTTTRWREYLRRSIRNTGRGFFRTCFCFLPFTVTVILRAFLPLNRRWMRNRRLPPHFLACWPLTPEQALRSSPSAAEPSGDVSGSPKNPFTRTLSAFPQELSPVVCRHVVCGSDFQLTRIRGGMPSSQAALPALLLAVASIVTDGCSAALMPDRSSV